MKNWEQEAASFLQAQQQEAELRRQEAEERNHTIEGRLRAVAATLGIAETLSAINGTTAYWGGKGSVSSEYQGNKGPAFRGSFGLRVLCRAAKPTGVVNLYEGGVREARVPKRIVYDRSDFDFLRWDEVPAHRVVSHRQVTGTRINTHNVWMGLVIAADEHDLEHFYLLGDQFTGGSIVEQPVFPLDDEEPTVIPGSPRDKAMRHEFAAFDPQTLKAGIDQYLLQEVIAQRRLETIPQAEARLARQASTDPSHQIGAWIEVEGWREQ